MEGVDQPIALRRTPRGGLGGVAPSSSEASSSQARGSPMAVSRTPSKPKSKKRVRFSDPGPEIEQHHHDASSTGLTPMVRRTSLGITPASKRRRHTTPARRLSIDDEDELAGDPDSFGNNEIRIVPLRQVLDDRIKRRIRRNGLSEEMNVISEEKKQRGRKQDAELQRLRQELAEKDEEIERLRGATMIQDADRIFELERQVADLRSELSNRSGSADQTQHYDWTLAARDPFADSYMDDDEFGDTTMEELVCSTPTRVRSSFQEPTPPCTSPTLPATPCSLRRRSVTPKSHTGVQVSLPDPEKEAMEAELGSLRLELTKLNETLESHEALKSRITERLVAAQSADAEVQSDVEAHLDSILQSLSDRTAALLDLNSKLNSLGFRGKDGSEVVSSIANAFRSARLELEYLTPGEITLPLSSHGAQVLDLILSRLRELARKVKENESAIDEYHELELSLRQQLGTRVEAMDKIRRDLKSSTSRLQEKDRRLADLELSSDRLKGAVEGYRRDIAELEGLVQRMETEELETEAQHKTALDVSKTEAAGKDGAIAELETKLAAALSQTAELRIQLADAQAQRVVDISGLNQTHGKALALRDARVAELRGEVDSVGAALRAAHETVRRLRLENAGLLGGVESERRRAKAAVDAMKTELERVLRMSEGILATPGRDGRTSRMGRRLDGAKGDEEDEDDGGEWPGEKETTSGPVSQPGSYLSGSLARSGRGRKRRKHDSGLGFLDEEEVDLI